MLVSPSLHDGNVFFIFRENGSEVKIVVEGEHYNSDKNLTIAERRYCNELCKVKPIIKPKKRNKKFKVISKFRTAKIYYHFLHEYDNSSKHIAELMNMPLGTINNKLDGILNKR